MSSSFKKYLSVLMQKAALGVGVVFFAALGMVVVNYAHFRWMEGETVVWGTLSVEERAGLVAVSKVDEVRQGWGFDVVSFLVGWGESIPKVKNSLLDGEMLGIGVSEEKVVAVMVENQTASRPQQVGIGSADIVYEVLVEGGITRFMLVFGSGYPEKVGPVRSARPYFVDWAREVAEVYVHAGGSPEGLEKVYGSELVDVDEGSEGTFRDYDYASPHNFFVNLEEVMSGLEDDERVEGLEKARFQFCDECERTSGGRVERIKINFSNEALYSVQFDYDSALGVYKRKLANVVHKDNLTGEQIAPKNVVVMYAPSTVVDEKGRLDMAYMGEGKAEFFTGGRHYAGQWKKDGETVQTVFFDPETGEEWRFDPGQIWICVVDAEWQVNLK